MKKHDVTTLWSYISEYEALNSCIIILEQFPRLKNLLPALDDELDAIFDILRGVPED